MSPLGASRLLRFKKASKARFGYARRAGENMKKEVRIKNVKQYK